MTDQDRETLQIAEEALTTLAASLAAIRSQYVRNSLVLGCWVLLISFAGFTFSCVQLVINERDIACIETCLPRRAVREYGHCYCLDLSAGTEVELL